MNDGGFTLLFLFSGKALKRTLDLIGASVALLLLWPVILIIAIAVRFRLGAPVLFSQVRPGLQGKPFRMFKFRSMTDAVDREGNPLPDDERMTGFGTFLRSSSLDELPELWNVLRGDMSLVGPRPLMMAYMDRYSPEQNRRHDVKPGVTGWAQVNGRNAIGWDEKFTLDVWYVDNQSLLLDIRILFLTLLKVILRQDVSAADHVTMPEFLGNNKSENESGEES